MDLQVTVTAPTGEAHTISLAQEGEALWADFVKEMQNAGHGVATVVRTVAERIKSTVAPVVLAGEGALPQIMSEASTLRDAIVKDLAAMRDALGDVVKQAVDELIAKHANAQVTPAGTVGVTAAA